MAHQYFERARFSSMARALDSKYCPTSLWDLTDVLRHVHKTTVAEAVMLMHLVRCMKK